MPEYLYKCLIHGEFEEEHSIKIKLEFCPKCKNENDIDTKIERLINCVSKGVVELTGQELINKLKQDAKNLQKDAANSEKIYSNLLGESNYQSLQNKLDQRKRR